MIVPLIDVHGSGCALNAIINILSLDANASGEVQENKKRVLVVQCSTYFLVDQMTVRMVGESENIDTLSKRQFSWQQIDQHVTVESLRTNCLQVDRRDNVDVVFFVSAPYGQEKSKLSASISDSDEPRIRRMMDVFQKDYHHVLFCSYETNDLISLVGRSSGMLIFHGYDGFVPSLKEKKSDLPHDKSFRTLALSSGDIGMDLKGGIPTGWNNYHESYDWTSETIAEFLDLPKV